MGEQFKSENQDFKEEKINYWSNFAMRHIPEMRVLFRGGKLWKKEGWRNVIEHSLPQGAAAEVFSDMLQLSEKEKKELIRNAICHDWDKRLEKKPEDFTANDCKKASDFIKKLGLNSELSAATKPDFIKKIIVADESGEDVPTMQLLIFYIDNITSGGQEGGDIVSIEDRISELQKRHPEFGSEHWEDEIKAGNIAQNKIYGLLKEKGAQVEKPEDIPGLIRGIIENKYSEYKE